MAKPNAQTGHGSNSGAADESALPNGEASGRGADASPDAAAKGDWGLPDATDNSSLSRILGLILVLVLVGVFSFVAYRKYNEARLHPQADATVADNNGTPPASATSDPAAVAANTTAEAPHALQQFEETGNPNAAFHPTSGGSPAGQAPTSQTGQTAKPAQTASSDGDANPFSDVGAPATSPNGSNVKVAQPDANQPPSAAAKQLASEDAKTDQSEPLFNEAGGRHVPSPEGRMAGRADSSHHHKLAAAPTENAFPNENGATDLTRSQTDDRPGRPAAPQTQSVQTTQNDQTIPTRQTASAPGVLSQSEPATNDLLSESPKTAEVTQNDHPSTPADSVPAKTNAHAGGGLLDQEEPATTTAKSEPAPISSPSAATASAPPRPLPQTAQSASTTTVHAAQPATDTEDLFAAKRSDVAANGGPLPIPRRQAPAPLDGKGGAAAGNTGMEATLNDAGDFYVVQPQDTFWTISRKKYGTARYFNALAQLNKAHVPDPTRMRPGVKVSTPPTEILETQFAQFLPKGSAIEVASGERQAAKSTSTGFFVDSDGRPRYRTGEKDTLSDIAARHLGRASRWIQVFEMNRDKLTSPNQLKVGTELVLPADASNVALTNDKEDRR